MKLFNMLTKHLSGQHDQASHGRRGSNVSESSSSKDRGIELYKPQKIVNEKYTLHEDGWIEYHDTSLKRRMEKLDNIADTYIYDANSKTMKTLVDAFKTSDGRRYNEIQIENLKNTNPEKFNAKGDLTIYRGGIIRSGYNSFSIDKDTAINYMVFNYGSNRGQREGTTSGRKLIEISISPEKIIALIGGGEVIIHSSKIKEKKEVKLFDILTKGGSGSGSWSGPGQPRFSHNSSVKKLDNKLISSIKDYAKNSIGTLKERLVIVKIDTKEVLADYEQELYLTNELTHERTSISGFSNANTFDANGNLHPDSSILDIHTHPENSSFSEGDWKIFVNSTIGEARIFSPDNEYILTKTKEFTSMDWTKRTPRVINEVYNRILADVEKDFSSIQISESYKFDKYVEEVIHEVSNRMSKEFNVNYIVNSDKSKKSLFDMIYKGGQGSGNFGHAGRPGEIGGSSDSGGGSFPKDAKDITSEQAMKQANYQDIKSQMKKNLSEIKQGESKQIDVSGELDSKTASNIEKNMKSELSLYGNYLAGDTMATARDYIDDFREVLNKGIKDGSLKDIKAEDLNKLGIDNVNKLIHQEIESNRQAFTDHGIRHIVGDVLRQRQIMREMNPEVTAKQELMGDFAMLNHDIGYTVPLIREGGERGIAMTKKHPLFSQKITEEQRDIWNKDKIFSVEEYNKITEVIKTHDSTKIDKNDILSTSSRISDNLSLFSKEKLPSVFKYVSGGDTYLVNMGIAAEKKDTASFEKHKKDLYKKIDESNISTSLKRDLKMATREIGFLTPKFTLGVLAGEIDSIKKESGKINISIQYNSYDAKMQKLFDMGQKQTKKFLEENGVTDFSKTKYDIGDMLRLEVKGYKEEKRLFDIVGKHLSGQHDQLSHGRRGSNVSESRINNSKPLEEIKSKFSDEDIPYGDWGSPLDSGKELYGWRGEGAGGSFGNSEGNGRYIAKEENLASFFGKPTRVRFIPPQNPFIVDNEPLYLLMESDELVAPVSKKDSIWLQVSKLAAKESERKLKGKWDAEDVGNRLTDILKKKGFDGVRVRSGGDEWVVIFDNAPIKSLLDILTKGGAGSGNFGHAGRPGAIGGSNANGSSKETIGRKDTNTPDEKQLKETVEQFNSFNPTKINNLKYKGLYDIVSKEGRFFTPEKQPRPKDIPKGEDKDCYRNTTLLAISNPDKYTYVEGIAFSKGINGLPFEHAWCIDNKTKKVIETTWKESGTAYYGVPFNSEYVMKMTFKNKVYGLMAGYSSGVKDIYENGFPENAIKKESKKVKSLLDIVSKGGAGSGNFAHAGRPGQIGGSGLEGNILITSKPSGFEGDKNILSKEGTVVNYDANFLKQEKAFSKRIKNEVKLWEEDRGDLAEAAVKEMSTPDSEYSEYRGIITKDKGEIVGAINFEFDKDKIYIHEIATKKKGYGENLIREVLKKAVENKIGIELFSTKEAADYYRKIGLKPKGRVPKGRAGIFELNYLEAKGWLTMHKSKYTEFEPESGCFADSRKVRDKRRRQIEKVSFTKMICDKIAGIKKEVNLFKEISLLDMLTKHFSGQHDQLSHGRRGGSNISESRTEKPAGSSRAGQSGKGGIGTWKPVLVKTTKVKVMNKKGIPIIDKETGKQKMKTKYTFLQENGKPLPKYMEGWSWRPNMKDPLYLQVDNPKDLKKIKVLAQGRVEGVLKDKWQCGLYKNPNGEKNTKTEGDYKKITVLDKNFNKVYAKNEKNRNSRDAGIRERADLTKLIMHSGIRVGGKEEENAAMRSATSKKIGEEVYGASTLLGKHVVKEGGAVYLRFPAKSGVLYDYEITDKSIAKMMIDRAKKAGAKGNVFNQDAVEYGKTSSYMKGLDSKQYTAKNFRTLTANRIAQKKISSMKKPKTKKEYIDSVNKVGITVGTVLGHRSKVPIYKKDKAGKPIKVKDKKTGKMVKVSTGKFEYKVSASTSIKNYISPALFKQWGEF